MNKAITQDIVIDAACADVFNELIEWGQSLWWPRKSLMQFTNLSGDIKKGTVYVMRVKVPCGPKWHARNEIIDRDKMYIRRVFLDGVFIGFEELSVVPFNGQSRAIYTFSCTVKTAFDRFMWNAFFRKMHIKNIESILKSLKEYLEKR